MEPLAIPEFIISPMRVLTLPEINYFHIAGQPTPFTDLDKDFDAMLDSLYAAKKQAHLSETGPDITRYYKVDAGDQDLYMMEVGIPVKPGMNSAGAAKVKTLPPYHCAGLLLWGSLAHIVNAYESLQKAFREAGLKHTGENQEWTYYFENGASPHNLMSLYMGVHEEG